MKKLLLVFVISMSAICAFAQDSLRYHYALLSIDRYNNIASVEYNNGFTEELWKELHFSSKVTRAQLLFRCFEYLNDRGYELVSSSRYTGVVFSENTLEYVFKRKKK